MQSKRKNQRHVSKKYDTQTSENDTLEIHTLACRFLNIFMLRHAHFSEHMPECDFARTSVISHAQV
jgi:hypothetical protein